MKKFEKELEKYIALGKHDRELRISHLLLMREYRSRFSRVAKILEINPVLRKYEKFPLRLFSSNLDPSINKLVYREISEVREKLIKNSNLALYGGNLDSSFILNILYYDDLVKLSKVPPGIIDVNCLEPIRLIFETFGTIGVIDGYYFVVDKSYEMRTSKKDLFFKLPSLDLDFLKFIDDKCGTSGLNIPSQNGVDILYKDFTSGTTNFKRRRPEL